MENPDIFKKELQSNTHHQAGGLDPLVILSLILKNWYIFIITIFAALYGARFYISHTMPVFSSSTTLLIKETGDRPLVNNDELLQGLGLPGGMRNIENQIMILTSRDLTEKALKELPFKVEYFFKTLRNNIPVYPDIPAKVFTETESSIPNNVEFSITYLGDNKFNLESESDYFVFSRQASFGETIETPGGSLHIELLNEDWFIRDIERKLYFVIQNRVNLISYYNSRLVAELATRGGSMLKISIQGTSKTKDVEFLNKLAEVFQAISLDKKNEEADRRIQFIDDQLVGISDSLSRTENKLQQFRSTNRVMDLSAQGQAIIGQVTLLENERARLNLEAGYYDYLADYLAKDISNEIPIVPINMGITDPVLTRLVEELAVLQQQSLNMGAADLNPQQKLVTQRMNNTKASLLETLNGLRRGNTLETSENEERIKEVNRQASTLPVTERQLLGFERKFRINDELYTFLLQTRANQQMQKASNVADSEVIDSANEVYSYVVAPNPIVIYFLGLFAGTGIPFLIILLIYLFNKKLTNDDIRRMTHLPIVGNIPKSREKIYTIVLDDPGSNIAEAYRLLRSRMQFLTQEAKSPVILITSSMPGEGKTFTAINLAAVYSLLGKKTILVGFDLRKPKIFQDFNLTNEKGVSTWLIGQDKLEDIIQETLFENLSIIAAGPFPPNPSELIALPKTEELIRLLKERYDYIIIDSSPIGIVSDTYHLAALADACLLVVRPGRTLRGLFGITLREISAGGIKGLSLVLNCNKSDGNNQSYGKKYGYISDKEKPSRFHFFRRKENGKK